MDKEPYLSVIIPIYNEVPNFRRGSLNRVHSYLASQPFSWEIILVNDGSTDGTLSLLQNFSATHPHTRVLDNPHQGKAASVMAGVFASAGQIILFTDTDQATPITEFDKFREAFTRGFDLAVGSRSGRPGAPVFRQILAYGMIIVRTLILRLPVRDTQCGFKAFTSQAGRKIFTAFSLVHPARPISGPAVNPGFDVEILYLARKMGFKIAEVPVLWTHQETKRVRFFHDAVSGLKELLLIRYRSLTHVYRY
ncbi:MAG: Glycosyl transferase family 2 [Candidatus Amesbacteria bacterium GW2011_GWB1_47_19]|nr:MAG: Glycosyl transferase family 2 [Candidatus Amesbacteria bacterium GW2011_GWA1_44_24]KKU31390.1 MAG: Glycosyl transferase family 2 [Candidatus Amesbacteria bacterium GW2011_GWC1_46_24]KKU66958.1 MAG: Glycosyl transferase family 2 [Candidatus Amesbacteria bacterium GW2011_GWB1_47_19]